MNKVLKIIIKILFRRGITQGGITKDNSVMIYLQFQNEFNKN